MLSIREIKARTEAFFREKGVPNPRLDTDILIAHSLGLKRLDLYLDLDRPLTEAQLAELRPMVKRRSLREPLQYILGTVEFAGLELKVDRRALIPRPETEELFQHLVDAAGPPPARILDLGTGSGALALALARHYPESAVTAVDNSEAALSLARENAAANDLDDRIRFLHGAWFEPLAEGERFDLIVSNPPYLTPTEMETAEPEVVVHEPRGALLSGADGLDDLRAIVAGAAARLDPGGELACETGLAQHTALGALAEQQNMESRSVEDMSGRARFFFARLPL